MEQVEHADSVVQTRERLDELEKQESPSSPSSNELHTMSNRLTSNFA